MESFFNPLMLSRWQFAVTTSFHIFFPLLSIGLSVLLVALEAAWLKTGKEVFYRHVRFWTKPFLLSFGIGIASGIPLAFQFGANWARFSAATDGFFGSLLGFEASMAFMLEAVFVGVMAFGWNRVSRRMHMLATALVAFSTSLSAFWIMDASSWMQFPTGVEFVDGKIRVVSFAAAIFNPMMPYALSHMWLACLQTSLFFVAGLSAWRILRKDHGEFFLASFKIALLALVVVTPLQLLVGDLSSQQVVKYQPAKAAAMEGHWKTNAPGESASWAVIAWPDPANQRNAWEINVPWGLSLLSTHSFTGHVTGLNDFPREDQPPVLLPFYSFRIMVGIGFFFLGVMLWGAWEWRRGRLTPESAPLLRWFLWAWIAAIPLGFIATDLGWIVREVGRQPWLLYSLLRTGDGVSNLDTGATAVTFFAYCGIYLLLTVLFVVYTRRIFLKGPDLSSIVPDPDHTGGGR